MKGRLRIPRRARPRERALPSTALLLCTLAFALPAAGAQPAPEKALSEAALRPISTTLKMPDFRQSVQVRTLQPGEACGECGRVQSVREVALERKGPMPAAFHGNAIQGGSRGVVDHNLVGAVVYLPLSSSSADKPFVGGVGTPEMRERFGDSSYAVTVRLDDGATRVVQRADGSRFHAGDRVRLVGTSDLELVVE